jgi:hypothetical protein
MKKAISILRIANLVILCTVGTLLLFGEEQNESATAFALRLILDKTLAIAMFALMAWLLDRWARKDEWLKAIDNWCSED